MKAAGGAAVQNAKGDTAYFQANLDTYGGNSGSPVFGMSSGLNNWVRKMVSAKSVLETNVCLMPGGDAPVQCGPTTM